MITGFYVLMKYSKTFSFRGEVGQAAHEKGNPELVDIELDSEEGIFIRQAQHNWKQWKH